MFQLRYLCCVAVALSMPVAGLADKSEEVQKHLEKGKAAVERQDFDRAIAEFTEAILLDPQNTLAYHGRATVHHIKGEFEKAIADFDQLLKLDPKCAPGYLERGSAHIEKGDYDEALADIEQAIRLDPKDANAYNVRGHYHFTKGDLDRAIRDITTAIRLNPKDARFYYNRGNSYGEKGDVDRSIDDYSEAIKLDPRMMTAYCNRAGAYWKLGKEDKALTDYDQSIRIDPNSFLPYGNRALLLAASPKAQVRNGKKAVEDARKACELTDWESPWCLDILAAAYAEVGDFKEAIKWEKRTLELSKDDSEKILREIRARLKLYEQGKPYRGDLSAIRTGAEKKGKKSEESEDLPATRPAGAEKDNRAHLLVILPANAELWVNGTRTTQTGSQRKFFSPVLTTGKHYTYEIKAIWLQDGERVEQVRTANVQANDWQKIDFTKADAEEVIQRFPIKKDSSAVVLPVTIDGKRCRFCLDTGCVCTGYDKSLWHLLGKITGRVKTGPPDENIMLPCFDPPAARLGKLALPKEFAVVGIDMTGWNKTEGEECQGFLGMDFLKAHIFRIDFDRGEVVFLRAVGPDPGQRLAIRLTDNQPQVKINLPGLKEPEWFVLDTGCVRGDEALWGCCRKDVIDALIKSGKLTSIHQRPQTEFRSQLVGQRMYRYGWLDSLPFAGNTHKNLLFSENDFSLLGLELLSRYVVTFDFPHQAIFLKKGRQFDRPIRQDLSGLTLERVKGQTVVESVMVGSPAARAGIRSGDRLLQIDKQSIDGMTLFTLRNRLREEGKRVQLTVRRGAQRLNMSLILSADN